MISLLEQLLIIIHCFLIGLFLGITYDSLTIIIGKKKLIIKYIIELCYWFLIIFIVTKYIINNINYSIRIYSIIFFIIGIIVYYLTIAKKHRLRLYFFVYFLRNTLNPFLKKTLLPTELLLFFKIKIKNFLDKRKTKNEENTITNPNDNNQFDDN